MKFFREIKVYKKTGHVKKVPFLKVWFFLNNQICQILGWGKTREIKIKSGKKCQHWP
jgi:hypothetical protein